MWGAQCLLEVRRRFWVGSGRPSILLLVRSAAALATMRPDDDDVYSDLCKNTANDKTIFTRASSL